MEEKPKTKKAKTSTERSRAFRKRQAGNQEYRKRENERIASYLKSKRARMNESERKQYRQQNNLHVRLCRYRKKMAKESSAKGASETGEGFKTPQSLGKAVKRLQRSLPKSPAKQREAVRKLASIVGLGGSSV